MSVDREIVLEAAARLVERRRYEQAILEYGKLIEAEPQDARTLLKIGELQCRLKAYGEAITAYLRAGDAYVAHGHAQKAIAAYCKVRELVASHAPELEDRLASLTFTIAELYRQLGFVTEAVAVLDERARRLEQDGQHAEAVPILRETTRMDGENASVRMRLAEVLSRAGDTEGAATELRVVASQLMIAGKVDEGLAAIERLLRIDPDPTFARMAAEVYLARGTHEDAVRSLSKLQVCVRADAKDLTALRLLVRAFGAVGHHEKADEVQKEIATIVEASGVPDSMFPESLPPDPPPLEPPSEVTARQTIEERGPIQVIPLSAEAFHAIAARMRDHGAGDEQVVAFVCQDGGPRSTMRTMYGVVKMLFD